MKNPNSNPTPNPSPNPTPNSNQMSAAGAELQGVQTSCGEVQAKAKAKQGELEQARTLAEAKP